MALRDSSQWMQLSKLRARGDGRAPLISTDWDMTPWASRVSLNLGSLYHSGGYLRMPRATSCW